jgi:hypothetical protein
VKDNRSKRFSGNLLDNNQAIEPDKAITMLCVRPLFGELIRQQEQIQLTVLKDAKQ